MSLPVRIPAWQRLLSPVFRGLAASGPDALPDPLSDPRVPAAALIAQAEARATADARRHVRDSWSFGDPMAEPSEEFDPSYVVSLRHQCDTAVRSALERHSITEDRTAHLRARIEEANQFMAAARAMMNRLAVRTARLDEQAADPGNAGDTSAEDQEDIDDDPVWEGDTVALGLVWRLLILLGIVVAETPVHYLVFQHFLTGRVPAGAIWALCGSMAVFLVTGPHVAALLVRARQATGAERGLTAVVLVAVVFWTIVVVVLGLMCGAVLDANHDKLDALNLTPATVVLMFVGGLVVAGTTAYLLGLARRSPYQEAYARHRRRRDELETLRRMMIDRLNPEHTEAGPDEFGNAIRAAYAAAEEAYFAALAQAVGDPSFTEAVQHRRGLRPAAQL